MKTRKSIEITSAIEDAETRLQHVESALVATAREQEQVLSSATFNNSALNKLEEQASSLNREKKFLTLRIDALIHQREEAEAAEAQARLDALPAEAEALKTECEAALADFHKVFAALIEQTKRLADFERRSRLLAQENAFLDERYEATARHHLASLPTPPNFQEKANQLLAAYVQATEREHLNEFELKRREWEKSGRKRPAMRRVA